MLPRYHVILGAVFSALLYPLLGWNVLIVFIATFITDIDHFFIYVKLRKSINPFKAYKFFVESDCCRKPDIHNLSKKLYIFHSIWFYVILGMLSLFSKFILLTFIGVMFHAFLDFVSYLYIKTTLTKEGKLNKK